MDDVLVVIDFLSATALGLTILDQAFPGVIHESELFQIAVLFALLGAAIEQILLPTLERIDARS